MNRADIASRPRPPSFKVTGVVVARLAMPNDESRGGAFLVEVPPTSAVDRAGRRAALAGRTVEGRPSLRMVESGAEVCEGDPVSIVVDEDPKSRRWYPIVWRARGRQAIR